MTFEMPTPVMFRSEDQVIDSNDGYSICSYARKHNSTARISRLQDAVIKVGDFNYIYYFARDVEGANIEVLQDAIINLKSATHIYYFARDIKGANRELLCEIIRKSNDRHCIAWALEFRDISDGLRSKLEKQLTLAALK